MTTSSGFDTFGVLYNSTFNPTDAGQNVLVTDDQNGGDGQFALIANLHPSVKYTVVVTTYFPYSVGEFVLNFYCSGAITFM